MQHGFEPEAEQAGHADLLARPTRWNDAEASFDRPAASFAAIGLPAGIVACVRQPRAVQAGRSAALLARTGKGHRA